MIGVIVSTVAIGFTLNAMNRGLEEFRADIATLGHRHATLRCSESGRIPARPNSN